jgi:hypothetical protein
MRVGKRFEDQADRQCLSMQMSGDTAAKLLRFFPFTSFRVRMTAVDAGVGHIARFWP